MKNIRDSFGNIDIYLFDQILKGRFTPGMKVLDAGCGFGRNLLWFLHNGFEIYAIDQNSESIEQTKQFAHSIALDESKVFIRAIN